jgi:hypothetical protein
VKAEIDHELATEELRKTLSRQAEMPELEEIIEEVTTLQPSRKKAVEVPPPQEEVKQAAGSAETAPRDVMDDNKQ